MAGRSKTKSTNKRNKIIGAAAELFDQVGYHGASMQMLADTVELGKPTLYHYFRSKNEILFAIHQDLIGHLLGSHMSRKERELPPDELLKGMCTDILQQINDHPGYVRAFIEHFDELDPEQQEAARKERSHYLSEAIDAIKNGVKSGLFIKCDPRLAALGYLGMCNWAYKWFPREKSRNVQKVSRDLSEMFLRGLLTRPNA
jgi:AcrR family transcriptional regulator